MKGWKEAGVIQEGSPCGRNRQGYVSEATGKEECEVGSNTNRTSRGQLELGILRGAPRNVVVMRKSKHAQSGMQSRHASWLLDQQPPAGEGENNKTKQ